MGTNNTNVPQCPGCGHFFYKDKPVEEGLCKWCVEEKKNPVTCHFCGQPATCSGYAVVGGNTIHLCNSNSCHQKDDKLKEGKLESA